MRTFLLLACLTGVAAAQIAAPQIGYVRRPDGGLYRLQGVAGAFRVSERVLEGVTAYHYDGTCGVAQTAEGQHELDCAPPEGTALAAVEQEELLIHSSGVRLRLPFAIHTVERAGAEYLLLSGEQGQLLARITRDREAVYELPQVAE